MILRTISIRVSGRVQGVYYRQSTCEKARELGITGRVRNEPDDTVFILATGTSVQLEALTTWCRSGPPRAIVENLEIMELELQIFSRFAIERR